MRTTERTVSDVLESIVSFDAPERDVEDVVDDVHALLLYTRRNGGDRELVHSLGQAAELGDEITRLAVVGTSSEKVVGHNFRAMVLATLDHTMLDVAVASGHSDPFTLLTTGASFILNRLAEYAYVESAKELQSAELRLTGHRLGQLMWDTLAENPRTDGIAWNKCQEYKRLVGQVRGMVTEARTVEPAARIVTLLFYVRLLEALQRATTLDR